MSSPIQNKIRSVFVHVRNTERSANFYHRVFGFPERKTTYDVIHTLSMSGGSGMILDQITSDMNRSERPLFMFHTEDVRASFRHIRELGIEIVWGIEDHGSMAFFTFRDPDGNLIMVCGNPGEKASEDAADTGQSGDSLEWAGDEWKHMNVRRASRIEPKEEGLLLQGRIESDHTFRTPLRMETVVRTDHRERALYLHFGPGIVTLNGGMNQDELIVQHPAAGKRIVIPGKGRLPKKEWTDLALEMGELEWKLYVNGKLLHSQQGDFRYVTGKAGIETEHGEVLVRALAITQEKPVFEPAQLTLTREGEPYGLLVPNPGCFARLTDDGLWVTNNTEPSGVWSTHSFKLPFECEAVVRADLSNLILRAGAARIKFIDGKVGFLDMKDNEEWHDYGLPPADEFITVKMTVEPNRMAVYMNGRFVAEHNGQYSRRQVGVAVGADIGSVVVVKSVDVRELTPGSG